MSITLTTGERARISMGRASMCPTCDRCVSIRTVKGEPDSLRIFYPHGQGAPCPTSEQPAPGWEGEAAA